MMNTPGLRARAYLLITKEALQKLFVSLERRRVHCGRNAACLLSHRLFFRRLQQAFSFQSKRQHSNKTYFY
jgi:hypothetical protein